MYDFETMVKRGNEAMKMVVTPEAIRKAGYTSFSGAEMDFATAPSMIRSMTEMIQKGVYGFTLSRQPYRESVCWWMKHARDWEIKEDWVLPVMGIIFSVTTAMRMLTVPGDGIIVHGPGYGRYAQAARRQGRRTIVSPMLEDHGTYRMDFENLERLMADPENRLLILCNPHNPTGRVWERWELEEIARLSQKYKVYVFSDEIFAEVTFDGRRTIPYTEIGIGEEYAMVCTALGKVFNFTGANHANMIIPDRKLYRRFEIQRTRDHYGSMEPIHYAAVLGAYCEEGLQWKNEMVKCVNRNRQIVQNTFADPKIPGSVFSAEGTYMCWIKWENPPAWGDELQTYFEEKALLSLGSGTDYGEAYGNYSRMNLGSTNRQTQMAMERLKAMFEKE